MKWSATIFYGLIVALPVAIEVPARDSVDSDAAESRLTVGGGGGVYALIDRGCEGEILKATRVQYRDVGAELEHRFAGPAAIGVRGGWFREDATFTDNTGPSPVFGAGQSENRYVNPYVRLDGKWAGIGGGPFWARHALFRPNGEIMHPRFSADVRLGTMRRVSLQASWMEGVPLLSEQGYFTGGVQLWMRPDLDVFVGATGAGPDDGTSLLLRGRWWVVPGASLLLTARAGRNDSIPQYGVALGITVRTPAKGPPRRP